MITVHAKARRIGFMLALGAATAACNSGVTTAPPTGGGVVVPTARQEDQFGVQFGTAFRADNNSEPYNPADGDIVAISLTTEPVNIN